MSNAIKNQVNLLIKTQSLKERSIDLRIEGLTYKQISDQLNVPPTTIRNWTGGVKLTETQKQTNRDNGLRQMSSFWLDKRLRYQQEGIALAKKHIHNRLFVMMCGLYWGEGHKPTNRNKNKGGLDLSNTDVHIMKLWIDFMQQFFNIGKNTIRIGVYYSPNDLVSPRQSGSYWLTNLNLNKNALQNVTISKKKLIYNNHPYGVCHAIVYSTQYLFQMIGAIKYVAGLEDTDKWNY